MERKVQLLQEVEHIDKTIRENLKLNMEKQVRLDAFVVKVLRACTVDIPELGEEWIASMQEPQFIRLFHMAFVTRKYNNANFKQECDKYNYEYLEFFGDTFLKAAMVEIVTKRFPQAINNNGKDFCSKIIIEYCKDENLVHVAKKYNFNLFIKALDHEKETELEKILEDVVEAFIGALWISCRDNEKSNMYRFEIIESFVRLIFDDIEGRVPIKYLTISNPKNILNVTMHSQTLCSGPRIRELTYKTTPIQSETTTDQTMAFHVKKQRPMQFTSHLFALIEDENNVRVHELIGCGTSDKKKEAENQAARAGIETLLSKFAIKQIIPPGWTSF